jgi:hypothetical protein
MNDFEKNMYQEIRMLREKFSILKLENAKLKEQLRWRPVSELPEKEGWYLCKTQYADDTFGVETVFFNGKNFIYSRVIAWLPIPPSY